MNRASEYRSVPPFLIGVALLFWGYEVDWLLVAAPMAAAVESARWVGAKWEFSDKDLNRIWDLCMVLLLGAVIVQITMVETDGARYQFFQWFPLIFMPLILGQVYGSRERFPRSAFSWTARQHAQPGSRDSQAIDVGYVYFGICLVAAGASNKREGIWFFAGVCALLAWALWATRPRRFPAWVWAGTLGGALLLGFASQIGLLESQRYAEATVPSWLGRFIRRGSGGSEATTSLGQLGRIKASSEIILRVQPDSGVIAALLKTGTFRELRIEQADSWTWTAVGNRFGAIKPVPESDGTSWRISEPDDWNEVLTIYQTLPKRAALLALPRGTAQIHDLPAKTLENNGLGTIRVNSTPGFVAYQALFENRHPAVLATAMPTNIDLAIPASETNLMAEVASELSLTNQAPNDRLTAISAYFARGFTFSLYAPENAADQRNGQSPLRNFLTQTHSGHCEYFATATVLLLRKAGFPARYLTGYSLQEREPSGLFVVRERHAHAWAEYWMDGQWHDLDTTPGGWNEAESRNLSRFQWFFDWKSNLFFRFDKWRWLGDESWVERLAPFTLAPMVAWLLWGILKRKRAAGNDGSGSGNGHRLHPGGDSEFYWVERYLASGATHRPTGVPLAEWLGLRLLGSSKEERAQVNSLLELHYRYRFDPAGLPPDERSQLREGATQWLTRRAAERSRSAAKGVLRG